MSYLNWGRTKERNPLAFDEKAYKRKGLAAWDAAWQKLSDQARFFVLHEVKIPLKTNPGAVAEKFPLHVLEELTAAGFIEVQKPKGKETTDRVVAPESLLDFITRLRMLHRMHLLAADQHSRFENYVDYAFYTNETLIVLHAVLRKASIEDYGGFSHVLAQYVSHRHWPGWVAHTLNDPLAKSIIGECQEANGPIQQAGLPTLIKGSDPNRVRRGRR